MRPEIDEVDRFRDRTDKSRKGKTSPPPKDKISAGGPTAGRAATGTAAAKPRTPGWVVFLILLLVGACAYLGWMGLQQQTQIKALNKDLEDAVGFISQSKLLMARLEGDLSETGAEMAESGTAVEKKLVFLDSEMRKLWGVANDRNKKAIAENKDKSSALDVAVKNLQSSQKKLQSLVDKTSDTFETSITRNQTSLKDLRSQLSLASGEISITRESLEENIASLSTKIDQRLSQEGSLANVVKENTQALEAVNESRKQLNDRVLALTEKLEKLQNKIDKAGSAAQ